jgi:Undecaprenyl-phosphate galactose phosphotransferase WbaP
MTDVEVRFDLTSLRNGAPQSRAPLEKGRIPTGAARRHSVAAWLFAGDALSAAAAVALAAALATAARLLGAEGLTAWILRQAPLLLLLLIAACIAVSLHRSAQRSPVERFRMRVSAMLLFSLAAALLFLHEDPEMVVTIPILAGAALVLGSWAEHWIIAYLIRRGLWCTPAAVLGAGEDSRALARLLAAHPDWGLAPIGFITEASEPATSSAVSTENTLPILGSLDSSRFPPARPFDVLVVPDIRALPVKPESLYRLGAKHILIVSQTGEFPTFGLQTRHFDRCIGFEISGRRTLPSLAVKRIIDLALALPFALIAAPLIGLLALAIKITDPGPAFYIQRRVGCAGKQIGILKLRTMYSDAEERLKSVLNADAEARAQWERHFKLKRDPRVLPKIGGFLRRTSLDELPQIWNVIRGEMSLVGPRPFPSYHMNAFDPEFRALRSSIPPGLTGLWQISSRSEGDLAVQRAQDCFYIRHRSVWLDIYILIATLPAVIKGQGAR